MRFQTESTEKGTCKHCLKRRKRGIQKRAKVVLDNLPKGFTAISLDESSSLTVLLEKYGYSKVQGL